MTKATDCAYLVTQLSFLQQAAKDVVSVANELSRDRVLTRAAAASLARAAENIAIAIQAVETEIAT